MRFKYDEIVVRIDVKYSKILGASYILILRKKTAKDLIVFPRGYKTDTKW